MLVNFEAADQNVLEMDHGDSIVVAGRTVHCISYVFYSTIPGEDAGVDIRQSERACSRSVDGEN